MKKFVFIAAMCAWSLMTNAHGSDDELDYARYNYPATVNNWPELTIFFQSEDPYHAEQTLSQINFNKLYNPLDSTDVQALQYKKAEAHAQMHNWHGIIGNRFFYAENQTKYMEHLRQQGDHIDEYI